jgi:hypothetical protein
LRQVVLLVQEISLVHEKLLSDLISVVFTKIQNSLVRMSATTTEESVKSNSEQRVADESDKDHEKWALPLKVIYQLALKFFKGK